MPHLGICADVRKFNTKLLLAIGVRIGQFKIGQNFIFFRSNQHDKMQQLLSVDSSVLALKRYIARTRWLILFMLFVKFTKKGDWYETVSFHNIQWYVIIIFLESSNKIEKEQLIDRHIERRSEPLDDIDDEGCSKVRKTTKQTKSKKPSDGIRYDCVGHWPEIDSKKNASRCKNETCTFKTHFFCSKCKVYLCIRQHRNCFRQFHTLIDERAHDW